MHYPLSFKVRLVLCLCEPLDTWADNFDGEMYAIFMAIRAICDVDEPSEQNIVILVDSQAAIQSITDYTLLPSELELECKQHIDSLLRSGRRVVFQWIPSHCGIYGNERADILAKEASSLLPSSHPVPLRNAKRLIGRKIRLSTTSALKNMADGKSWACLLNDQLRSSLSLLPRAWGVACFRTINGHDYLQAHLYKINLADSPNCVLCGTSQMTGEHLFCCPSLSDTRSSDDFRALSPSGAISTLYWTARRLMSEMTKAGIIKKKKKSISTVPPSNCHRSLSTSYGNLRKFYLYIYFHISRPPSCCFSACKKMLHGSKFL